MSTTPSQAGAGGAGGGAFPKRPAAYPTPTRPTGSSTGAGAGPASPGNGHAKHATPAAATAAAAPAPNSPSHDRAGKSVSGPPAAPPKPDLFSQRNLMLGGSALAGLVLFIALLVWRPWQPTPPRLNEQPYKIAQFAATSGMDRLPWSQQREFMEVLDAKDKAVLAAYNEGKLSDQEYRRALQLAWYGKHLDRMDKFFNRPPQLRQWYIDEKVLGKKIKKNSAAQPGGKQPDANKEDKPKKDKDKSDDTEPLKADEIDRDDSTEAQDIKKWPGEVQAKWAEYRRVLAERKEFFKELERQEKEKRKAAEASAAANKAGAATGAAAKGAGTGSGTGAAGVDKPAGTQ